MSDTYLKEQRSKGNSKVSRRWKVDVRDIVNNYDFHFNHANANGGKCDLCGNRLIFVAVIEGKHLTEANTADKCYDKVYNVGFDCLQLVFGRGWNDFHKAKRAITTLKAEAAQHRRVIDYADRFKDIIKWIKGQHPDLINNNTFLSAMREILLDGTKVFTINMEGGIRRFMARGSYSKDVYDQKLKHHKDVVLPRLKMVYELVARTDKVELGTPGYDAPKWSSYKFVQDVFYKARELNKVSPSQLEWMNKIYERYLAKNEKRKPVSSEAEYESSANIPF